MTSNADTASAGTSRRSDPPEEPPPGVVARGALLGRYLVLRALGSGATGNVFAAYDPELDRKVALKVLAPPRHGPTGWRTARLRLRREAQAIARLRHRNVVTVFDVGSDDEPLFIAMELLEGPTLGEWLRAASRSWRRVVEVFLDAGRGLAAAHDVGLVHRDFKPSNVMIDRDGRVVVLDFGLARIVEAAGAGPDAGPPADAGAEDDAAERLTRAGQPLGTPGYMAPEQRAGREADERADQYSFCVALHEALTGELPAPGGGARPRDARVPGWLRRPLRRGLEDDPARRFASLDDLLAVLDSGLARSRILRLAVVLAVVLVALGAAGWLVARPGEQLCRGAGEHLREVWGPRRQAEVRASMLAAGGPLAEDTRLRVERRLDAYTGEWARSHTEACEATRLRGEVSEAVLDRRMTCLSSRLREVRAAVNLLSDADQDVVLHAVDLVQGLPDISFCDDLQAVVTTPLPPTAPAVAKRVEKIRTDLATARSEGIAGHIPRALALAESADAEAAGVDYPPVQAEARFRLATLLGRVGRHREQTAALTEAAGFAAAAGHDEAAARALVELIVAAVQRGDPEEARRWEPLAAGAVERLGRPAELEIRRLQFLGLVETIDGKNEAALERYDAALALHPDPVDRASLLSNSAIVGIRLGRLDTAGPRLKEALAVLESVYGPDHPITAPTRYHLGELFARRGESARALEWYQGAYEPFERTGQAESPQAAIVLTGVARSLIDLHRASEAREILERSLPRLESWSGNPAELALARFELARALVEAGGDRRRAMRLAAQAREALERIGEARQYELGGVDEWLVGVG